MTKVANLLLLCKRQAKNDFLKHVECAVGNVFHIFTSGMLHYCNDDNKHIFADTSDMCWWIIFRAGKLLAD